MSVRYSFCFYLQRTDQNDTSVDEVEMILLYKKSTGSSPRKTSQLKKILFASPYILRLSSKLPTAEPFFALAISLAFSFLSLKTDSL